MTAPQPSAHPSAQEAAIVHGGPDGLGNPAHDFSTNCNATGPCPIALAAVHAADPTRYPDPSYQALIARLADWHQVDPSRIVLAASGSDFITRITTLQAHSPLASERRGDVWIPAHAYGDYARAAANWGVRQTAHSEQAGLLWACDPSSPLGQAQADLSALADRLDADHQRAVLDLAYAPLRLSGALALSAAQCDRFWQLHTPNKALGLAGVRAACAIAPDTPRGREDARLLRARAPSWVLGAHGVALLHAWTEASVQAWLADSLPTLRRWKARQQALCASVGWQVEPSDSAFFCARPPADIALPGLLRHLRERDIKLRDTTSFGLPGAVRLGVLPPTSQDALIAACGDWRQAQGLSTPSAKTS
jgi:histidinol-phosphate aminotransferase